MEVCKRCLIREMAQLELAKGIESYISRIDEQDRTEAAEYEKRLNICKECNELISGTCRKCGCYVELRAATGNNHCPALPQKW